MQEITKEDYSYSFRIADYDEYRPVLHVVEGSFWCCHDEAMVYVESGTDHILRMSVKIKDGKIFASVSVGDDNVVFEHSVSDEEIAKIHGAQE